MRLTSNALKFERSKRNALVRTEKRRRRRRRRPRGRRFRFGSECKHQPSEPPLTHLGSVGHLRAVRYQRETKPRLRHSVPECVRCGDFLTGITPLFGPIRNFLTALAPPTSPTNFFRKVGITRPLWSRLVTTVTQGHRHSSEVDLKGF